MAHGKKETPADEMREQRQGKHGRGILLLVIHHGGGRKDAGKRMKAPRGGRR
jgi:hypothetical protein